MCVPSGALPVGDSLALQISVLALLVALPVEGRSSSPQKVEGSPREGIGSSHPVAARGEEEEAAETQQVSLITTIEYLPVEAKKSKSPQGKKRLGGIFFNQVWVMNQSVKIYLHFQSFVPCILFYIIWQSSSDFAVCPASR